ncbi:MAG TPA: DUF4214 domain-containing protein [Burkholderiaceae bacterium]
MAATTLELQRLYLAYFSRPADPDGLANWMQKTAADTSLLGVAQAFGKSLEYTDRFKGLQLGDLIDKLYVNLFARHAESSGIDYWADALARKAITFEGVAMAISTGAQGSDLQILNRKLALAQEFTALIDTPIERVGYSGYKAAFEASYFVSTVTDEASLARARIALPEFISRLGYVVDPFSVDGNGAVVQGGAGDVAADGAAALTLVGMAAPVADVFGLS